MAAGGGGPPRAGRDTTRPETAGGALTSRRHGPWTSIRVCADVCVTAARVGSESLKRREKLDGRAQGCTRSVWGPGRLGKAIGYGLPDKFEKCRRCSATRARGCFLSGAGVLAWSHAVRRGSGRGGLRWPLRVGRDSRLSKTVYGALMSSRHGPWASIRACADVCDCV